ncbi:MAG: hypothetical protein KZQ77_04740 [Candidatus Thiodiazotropha sp. (ex Notomyrtea botanica)]|nr:hypothetical protein [Candidatus Thiodiazotropha sp. (ex Notomyrtea botanica)]
MIRISSLIVLLVFLSVTDVLAIEGSSIGVFVKTRQDIDYNMNTLGVSASLITPAGLFRCVPGVLSGESRIDSFNNIVGVSDVRNAEWKRFTAHDLECRYGAKWNAAEGMLKAGFGLRNYLGKTADEPGGKNISIKGAGALLDYDSDSFDAKLEWKREIHDYTLKHKTAFGDYDSLVDATEDTYIASGTYKVLYLDTKYVSGNKDNVYTTPLYPTNRFRYAYTDIAVGMTFESEGYGLTLIAPIFGEGSYRGSFNPLEDDIGFNGIQLAGRINGSEIDLKIVRHEGEGSRPYLPATDKLTEHKETTTVSLGIKKEDWKTQLEYYNSSHTGHAAIVHPTYAAIVGGYGPFNNRRKEDKWTLSASFPVQKNITADIIFYYAARQDQQYNHPEHFYTEKGGLIAFKFSE